MDVESTVMDAEEQALRDMGREVDMNEGRPIKDQDRPEQPELPPEAEEVPQPPETETPKQPEPEEETEPAAAQKARDPVTGQFQKGGEKPETEYSRAQKEQARKDRSWQALQAEKERFRQMTSQWEERARMQQLEQTRRNHQPLQKDGLTAREYYEGALRFEKDGDYENAYKAKQVAEEMFQAEQQRAQQMQGVEAEYQWRVGMQEAVRANPEIGNPDSPVSAHLERIIQQNPWIYYIPQGFQRAAEVADMLTKMAALTELQDENEKLRADLERFQKKGQPARGGAASPRTTDKDFEDMNLEEMEAHLKQMTAEADNYR